MAGKHAKATQEDEEVSAQAQDLTGGVDAEEGDGYTVVQKGKGKQKGKGRGRAEVNPDSIVEDRSQAPKRMGDDIDDSERAAREEKPKSGKGGRS